MALRHDLKVQLPFILLLQRGKQSEDLGKRGRITDILSYPNIKIKVLIPVRCLGIIHGNAFVEGSADAQDHIRRRSVSDQNCHPKTSKFGIGKEK